MINAASPHDWCGHARAAGSPVSVPGAVDKMSTPGANTSTVADLAMVLEPSVVRRRTLSRDVSMRGATIVSTSIVIGLAVAACCDESVNAVDFLATAQSVSMGSPFFIGDTLTFVATAESKPGVPCGQELYSSGAHPSLFTFSSADTTVATVSPQGLVTARGLGVTAVNVITAGVSSGPIPVRVEPRFASIRVLGPSSLAHVGDTLSIHVDALDSAGNVVPGVYVSVIEEGQTDSVVVFVRLSPHRLP